MASTSLILNLTAQGGSQVTATLDQISQASERTGQSVDRMGRIGQAATYALGQAMYSLVSQVTSVVEAVVVGGLKMDASLQQSQVAFEGLTGNVKAAQEAVDGLATIAANTNYSTDQVVGWGKAWVAAGGNIDFVVDTMTTLTDAGAHWGLTQDQLNRVLMQFNQSMMVGKLQWQDIKIMMEDGLPVVHELAKAYHTTDGAIVGMIQSGSLLSKDALPKLQAQLKMDSAGAAAKQATTLAGAWDNLTDKIFIAVAKGLKPYNDTISNGVIKFTNWAASAIGNFVSTAVPALIHFGGIVYQWVSRVWQDAQPFLQRAVDFITGTLIPDLGVLADFITGSVWPAAMTLYDAFGGDIFGTAWAAVQWGIDNLPTLGGWLTTVAGFVADNKDSFEILGGAVLGAVAAYKAITIATGLWRDAQIALDIVLDANPISLIIIAVAALVAAVVILWVKFQGFRQFVETMWNAIVTLIGNAIKGILGYIKGLIDTIGSIADHLGIHWLDDMVKGADTAVDKVNAKLDSIQRNIQVTVEVSTVQVTDSHGNQIDEVVGSANLREDRGSNPQSKSLGLKGKNNETRIWNYLRGQGFSAGAAAGVIGNLIAESGLDPGIFQRGGGPGRGLAQWSAGGRWDQLTSWTRAHGMNYSTLDGQLAFMMHELQSGGFGSLSALKHMSSDEAAAYFMNHYEMPASRNPSGRQSFARAVLGRHGGGTASTPRGRKGSAYGGLSGPAPFDTKTIADDLKPRSSFMKAILAGASQLKDQFYKLIDDVDEAHNKLASHLVRNYGKNLQALAKVHDGILKKLKDAQAQAKKLRDASLQLFTQTRDSILKTGDVTTGEGKDFGSIVSKLQNAVNKARQFVTVVNQLRAAGLNKDSMMDIIQAGPDQGLAYAQSILASGKGGISEINTLEAQLGKAGDGLGTTASNMMYKAAIHAADGFVKGLSAQKGKLEALMTAMANAMAKALRKALGIKSPSTVFAQIGHHTADGLIHGMHSRRGAVMHTAADLVAVGMGSRSPRALPAGRARVQPLVVHVHGYVGGDQQLARKITEIQARYSGRGVNGAA